MAESGQIVSRDQFKPTPEGKAARWAAEMAAAFKAQDRFWKDGEKALKEFLGEKAGENTSRMNLFYADVKTKEAFLSGTPKVRAKRRYADANDDVARVAAEIIERLLNQDIERDTDGYRASLANGRNDWIRAGMGVQRFRYTVDMRPIPEKPALVKRGKEVAPAVPAGEEKAGEDVDSMHVNWHDFVWSPCRTWDEIRWVAFRWEMTKDEAKKRFGDATATLLPLKSKVHVETGDTKIDKAAKDAWSRVEGWEIWDKDSRTVYWWVSGYDRIVDEKPDPLGLPNFFPCQEPLASNLTTAKWMPRADFYLVEDLYQQAHQLATRIRNLVRAAKVKFAYNSAEPALQRMYEEADENDGIPVTNWGQFSTAGGLKGNMDFAPTQEIANTIGLLVEQLGLIRQQIWEVLGIADLMRGQQERSETATASRIKGRAFSARIQSPQDEYQRFASDGQRIRAHIIAKWFEPQTIVKRSNIEQAETMEVQTPPPAPGMPPGPPQKVPNRPLIDQAVQLIKSNIADFRIDVDGESLSMTDFDAVQQEAIAFMQATAEFFSKMAPLAVNPDMATFIAELYQQFACQLRGAERFEGVIDRFIANMEAKAAQPPQPPPPDPKVEAAKIQMQTAQQKAQLDQQKGVMDLQAKREELNLKRQAMEMDIQAKAADLHMKQRGQQMDAEAQAQDHALRMQERVDEHEMASEEREESHAIHREEVRMGLEASREQHKQKLQMAKSKPKPKGKED